MSGGTGQAAPVIPHATVSKMVIHFTWVHLAAFSYKFEHELREFPAVLAVTPRGVPDPNYGNHGRVVVKLANSFEEAADIVRDGAKAFLVGRVRGRRTNDDIGAEAKLLQERRDAGPCCGFHDEVSGRR